MGKRYEPTLWKRIHANGQQTHKKISLVIKSMSVRTIMRYHHVLTRMRSEHRMTKIKKTDNTSVGKDTEQLEFLYVVGGDVKWYNDLENSLVIFEEVKHIPTT